MHRMSGTDVVAAAQISAGTGGGRIATLGAVIGFCLSGIGAGTVCVVTGVIELSPAPKTATAPKRKPAPTILPEEKRPPRREPKAARPVATRTPTPATRSTSPGEPGQTSRQRATDTSNPTTNRDVSTVAREFNFEAASRSDARSPTASSSGSASVVPEPSFEEAVQQAPTPPQAPATADPTTREFGG
jgi:hypothetical protein